MKRLAFAGLACAGIIACSPPYLPELDSSAALTRQMTTVGTLGPFNLSGGNSTTIPMVRFFPSKPTASDIGTLSVQNGFAVTETGGTDYLQFAYLDSSGNPQVTSGMSFSLSGTASNYPQYQYEVTTTTTSADIVVFNFDPSLPSASNVTSLTATLPSGPLGTPLAQVLNTVFSPSGTFLILGESVMPAPYPTPDAFNMILSAGAPPYSEGSLPLGPGPTVFPSSVAASEPLLTLPAGSRFLYYTNPTGTLSYAELSTGSGWVCYQWALGVSAPAVVPGITHRIDALLTSGDLLSTEGGILRLYDSNGNLKVSVSLGSLQFCYEAYVGLTPYVFFSLPINMSHGNWSFRAYAIPTSSMRSLGG